MGKAAKWFKALFTFKNDNNVNNISETPFAGICRNPATIPPNISPSEAAWLRSFYIETEQEEQSKHAIAVAAATAAAADAAIVAAQAAVEVVKLTGNGRVKMDEEMLQNCRERYAAIRIQSVFRGYLGRRALRALRSLVKIQAVVRGFLVRKQAAATLKCMQALVRAQETIRSKRVNGRDSRLSKEFVSRRSLDNVEIRRIYSRRFSSTFDSIADERAKIVEMDTGSSRTRSRRSNLSVSEAILNDQANYKAYYSSTRLSPYSHRESDWELNEDEFKFSTANSTPKFSKRSSEWTPLNPSYMANTQSFKAKARSHSAPRQRSSDGVLKTRASLLELMEARKSLSQVSVSFKNAVMRKIDGSSREESDEGRNGNGNYNNAVGK